MNKTRKPLLWIPVIFTALLFLGCDEYRFESGLHKASASEEDEKKKEETKQANPKKIDLDEIKARGEIRIIAPKLIYPDVLPRKGFPLDVELEEAKLFAEHIGVKPVLVYVDRYSDLIPYLLEGKGDFIAAGMTATESRREKIAFSVPLTHVEEMVVVRSDYPEKVEGPEDLQGKVIVQRKSSAYWETLSGLQKKYPDIHLRQAGENRDTESILYDLSTGRIDITVADSNIVEATKTYLHRIKPAFALSGDRVIAWGVRPDAEKLLDSLNHFLQVRHMTDKRREEYLADFSEMKKRKVLRVLTRNSASTYFLWRGKLLGFEYELMKDFAKKHGMRVEIIVPPRRDDLIPWLLKGKGDVIAASMTITEERKQMGLAFSKPYNTVEEIVVCRNDKAHEDFDALEDLNGRRIVVRQSSSYWQKLSQLQTKGVNFTLVPAPEELETEEIIDKVAKGDYDLTLVDGHILSIELAWRDDIKGAIKLPGKAHHGWVGRKDNETLLSELNHYVKRNRKKKFFNMTYNKYFKNQRRIIKRSLESAKRIGRISPYDELIKQYANEYGFDWRLITSQIYQESRFDPLARSFAGAVGLMQLLPSTGKEMGIANLTNPKSSIYAGTKYMDTLRERFEEELSVKDRIWFTLASYNAGYGHVLDARRLAAQLDKDPNRWFDNVEVAMLLLSKPHYARQARYGYVRGRQPVDYVKKIHERYLAYSQSFPP